MINRLSAALLLLGLAFQFHARDKFWIFFRDKSGTPYNVSEPSAFLSGKSIDRRQKQHIRIDVTDLPVNPSYISALGKVKYAKVLFASKWLNGALIAIDSTNKTSQVITEIAGLPFVAGSAKALRLRVNYREPEMIPDLDPMRTSGTSATSAFSYGKSLPQLAQMRVNCLHEQGLRGQGMTIAVMDAGFTGVDIGPIFDSLRSRKGILGTYDFVDGGTNSYHGSLHGTEVLSCMAGIKPGVVMGTAPRADYWLLRTEDGGTETISEEYNWVRAAEFADSVGADIFTTSLGYTTFDNGMNNHTYSMLNGRTAPMSIAANMAARKGIFVLNAAGNEGAGSWHYISVPGDADSICTVGAVDTLGRLASFSSVGPTSDGRIKPDLVSTGDMSWICTADVCFYSGGTSFATPLLAGAVACYWQAFRNMTNMQLLSSIKSRGSNASSPDNRVGWGFPRLCDESFDFTAYTDADQTVNVSLTLVASNNITVEMTDMVGHVIFRSKVSDGTRLIRFNAAALADGLYVVRVQTDQQTLAKKIAKD